MEKNRTLLVLISLIVIFLLFKYSGFLGSLFAPEDVGVIQYAGGFDDTDIWHTVQTGSMTAILGEYRVEVEKDDFRYEPIYSGNEATYECGENTCGGEPDHIDADGCQIWKKSNVLSSCTAKSGTPTCMPSACNACCFESSSTPLDVTHCKGEGGCLTCGCIVQYCNKNYVDKECGGLKPTNILGYCCDYQTCWGKFKIYRNNILLKETPWIIGGSLITTTFDYMDVTKKIEYYLILNNLNIEDLGIIIPLVDLEAEICPLDYRLIDIISLGEYWCINKDVIYTYFPNATIDAYQDMGLVGDLFYGSRMSYGSCLRIENTFRYKIPQNAFSFDVSIPTVEITEKTENYAYVEITNNWKPVKGNLTVVYNIPYKVLGITKELIEVNSKIVDIPTGKSTFLYPIPADMPYGTIKITPTFYVLMDGSEFSGVNGICFGQEDNTVRPLNGCEYVLLGTLYGDEFNVSIIRITEPTFESVGIGIGDLPSTKIIYPGQTKSWETSHIDITTMPRRLKATFIIKAVAGALEQTKGEVIVFER